MQQLLSTITTGTTVARKAAAYALGQIGDRIAVERLRERYGEAIVASLTAIVEAPADGGHSEAIRRQIIEDVYEQRRPSNSGLPVDAGSPREAIRLIREILTASIANPASEKILPRVKRILELEPDNDNEIFLFAGCEALAYAAMDDKDADAARNAIRLADRLLRHQATKPQPDPTHMFVGFKALCIAHFYLDEYAKSKDYCQRALRLMPDSEQMLMFKGWLDGHT